MAKFDITVWHPILKQEKKMHYDNQTNRLIWENGSDVLEGSVDSSNDHVEQVNIDKGKDPNLVKILLGLSCNYECDYCNQKYVPHAEETNPANVQSYVDKMDTWFSGGTDGKGTGTRIEFWGGEPLVYWKTLKPLAESIRAKYPHSQFSMITNGSLLDAEKNKWLIDLEFIIGMSHDGPGQPVRGPDPFDDAASKVAILSLFKELAPKAKMSFNTMLNNKNYSRIEIEKYFITLIETNLGSEYLKYLKLGEGAFVDAYDVGGVGASLSNVEEEINFRNSSYNEIRSGNVKHFTVVDQKVKDFLLDIKNGTRSETVGQKCGMDKSDAIAMDLNGNILTCQNVSTVSVNPSGISHHLGTVDDLKSIEVKTATHWSDREECPKCPVLHLCKGACFFLTGPLWETTCNNAFSDNIVLFTTAIEFASNGWTPIYIEGSLRNDRKDIFWWVNGKPETTKSKKIIPILAI